MKEKFKNFYSKIGYAIIPFIVFVCTLLISYFGNQLLYNWGLVKSSTYPLIELDSQIPLIPWFVYFYYLTFPLGIFAFFYLAYTNKKAFYNMYIALVVSFAISGIIYLFAQTEFIKPDFQPQSFTDNLVVWTWGATNPINCFPSQHCFMAFGMILSCIISNGGERKMNMLVKIVLSFCSIMIILATVFIKQHYFLDILASFDILFLAYALCAVFKVGERMKRRSEGNFKPNKKILKKLK